MTTQESVNTQELLNSRAFRDTHFIDQPNILENISSDENGQKELSIFSKLRNSVLPGRTVRSLFIPLLQKEFLEEIGKEDIDIVSMASKMLGVFNGRHEDDLSRELDTKIHGDQNDLRQYLVDVIAPLATHNNPLFFDLMNNSVGSDEINLCKPPIVDGQPALALRMFTVRQYLKDNKMPILSSDNIGIDTSLEEMAICHIASRVEGAKRDFGDSVYSGKLALPETEWWSLHLNINQAMLSPEIQNLANLPPGDIVRKIVEHTYELDFSDNTIVKLINTLGLELPPSPNLLTEDKNGGYEINPYDVPQYSYNGIRSKLYAKWS